MNVVVEKSVCSFINGDLIAVKSYSNEILLMIIILQRFSVKMKRILIMLGLKYNFTEPLRKRREV